jgi:hypothetical protein
LEEQRKALIFIKSSAFGSQKIPASLRKIALESWNMTMLGNPSAAP